MLCIRLPVAWSRWLFQSLSFLLNDPGRLLSVQEIHSFELLHGGLVALLTQLCRWSVSPVVKMLQAAWQYDSNSSRGLDSE